MPKCDCCRKETSDASARPGLRAYTEKMERTITPFAGVLCADCFEKSRHFGTPEHGWLVKQLASSG
jgi:hypothetical protein